MIDHEEQNYGKPFMDRYSEYTYSDWFCEMSRGEYDFIGDEYYIQLPLPSTEYINLGYNRASLNRYILEYANNNIPSLDFTRYDKWSYSNGNWVWGSDGTAEMVIMHYRRIPNNDNGPHTGWFWNPAWGGAKHHLDFPIKLLLYLLAGLCKGGEASLGFSNPITLDGITIGYGNGVTALGLLNRTTRTQLIVEHEVCHYALSHTSLGLMTPGHGESTYLFLPHEREAMGYITPTYIYPNPSIQDFTLEDYTETGQVLKLAIPGSSDETFWVANHQKKSKYDGLSRGSNTCWTINRAEQDPYCSVGKGLYISHQSYCANNLGMDMDIECSDGKYDWDLDRTVQFGFWICQRI